MAQEICEGSATISVDSSSVFYNPVQQFNRDVSILAIRAFLGQNPPARPVRLLEALAATGLRTIRYAKEIDGVEEFVANDLCPMAAEAIRENLRRNRVAASVQVTQRDATQLMLEQRSRPGGAFWVVDVDPFGSAAPFLEAAVQALGDGGLLCVTCTDAAVLCGTYPETCWARYRSLPVHGVPWAHEGALRVLLGAVDAAAGRYRRWIEPLLSLSVDFYVRCFVRIHSSAAGAKRSVERQCVFWHCTGCRSTEWQPLGKAQAGVARGACGHCGHSLRVGGPLWSGSLHDKGFVQAMLGAVGALQVRLGTEERIRGVLAVVAEELEAPFYVALSVLAKVLGSCTPPFLEIFSALLRLGHRVSLSHCHPNALKTDAPWSTVWRVLCRWVVEQQKCPLGSRHPADSPARALMAQYSREDGAIGFELHPQAEPPSRRERLLRYQENPAANWGPMARPQRKRKQEKEQ